jgi:putative CocE/NonD family hydrolase
MSAVRMSVAIVGAGAVLAALTGAGARAATPPGDSWNPGPAKYGVVKESNVPVEMSDGTVLRADVYRPADVQTGNPAAGRFPVLLAMTPYSKGSTTTTSYSSDYGAGGDGRYGGDGYYPYLVARGYINAVVEVRGSGSSGGSYDLFSDREELDGPDAVRWAAALPGSNGTVGLIGASYVGENQYPTAGLVGPKSPVKAMAPVIGAYEAYRDVLFPGGLYTQAFFNAYFLGLRYPLDAIPPGYFGSDPVGALATELQHIASLGTFYAPVVAQLNAGDLRYDGAFWDNTRFYKFIPQIVKNGIPALVIGGHFDLHLRGEPREYAAFQNAWAGRPADGPMAPGQSTTPKYQLIMGPWYHLVAFQGLRYQEVLLEWYDTWLKGKDTPFRKARNTVHVFDLGTRKWTDTNGYPYPGTSVKTYYLDRGPSGSAQSLNDGRLSTSAPAAATGSDGIDYSPADPLCTRAAEQWTAGVLTLGAYDAGQPASSVNPCLRDDRPLQARGLTYTTEPFSTATTLAGPIDVTLNATSTVTNAEFLATVEDIAPDGSSYPLVSGQQLGSLRAVDASRNWVIDGRLVAPFHPNTKATERAVTPGAVERYDIEVFPTFATLAAGHRLRLTITTSGNPFVAPVGTEPATLVGGHYEVQRNAVYASQLNVPLAPAANFAASPRGYGDCNAAC